MAHILAQIRKAGIYIFSFLYPLVQPMCCKCMPQVIKSGPDLTVSGYACRLKEPSECRNKLLTVGNTVAALDELYIWLSNPTAIEYIRNCLKRVRKKESAMLLASQNLEDFDQEQVREMTKPLFSIPPHQFLFNAGSIDKRSYMEMLQLDEAEYNLIKFPQRGVCLYKCGNERYLLEVHAPAYKEKLFGTAGGR